MTKPRTPLSPDAIVEVARRLMVDHGVEGVSLRRLASELGVTAPALYTHFENKDALLNAIAAQEFERLADVLEDAAAGLPDPIDRMKAQAQAYVRHGLANPAFFRVMFLFRPDWATEAPAPEMVVASKSFEVGARAVGDAVAAGRLRETDALLASLTVWAAVHGVTTVLLVGPSLDPAYETALVDSVIDNVVRGIST